MTTYTITEHTANGQRERTVYTFTRENGTYAIYEAIEASATGTGRRMVTVSLNMQPPGVRSSQRALAEARAEATPVSYARIEDGQLEELPLHEAVEAGLITAEDYADLSQPEQPEQPEPSEEKPAAREVTVQRDCYPTVTVSTTKGDIVADLPHIGHGVYAVDYSNKQVATIIPALHYATVRMNEPREEFRARNADEGAWSALARHLVARGYCVPELG